MTKTEYREMKEILLLERENKIEGAKNELDIDKDEYKKKKAEYHQSKKAYHKAVKALKKENKIKRKGLKSEYRSLDYEKELKIREKDLTVDQIKRLRDKEGLPFYLRSEEIFNSVTHIVGAGLGAVGLIIGVIFSCLKKPGDMISLFSMIVFGIAMITLYSISAIYHGLHINKGKKVLQVLDHCTIYILIAGTYTPVVLLGLQFISPWHYVFLAAVYALSILGVVLNATMMEKLPVKVISMILYIAVGWGIIFFYPVLINSLSVPGMWLLIGGGLSYTVGSILYGIGSKKRYFHSVFHLFVNVGTILQYLSILIYAVIK